MKRNELRFLTMLMVVIWLLSGAFAKSEGLEFMKLLSACVNPQREPMKITISADASLLQPFDAERTSVLNRLLSHFSLQLFLTKETDGFSLMQDQDEVFTYLETKKDTGRTAWFSSDPGHCYDLSGEDGKRILTLQNENLEQLISWGNRILVVSKEMIPFFESLPSLYPDFCKESSTSLQYRGFGKAVKRHTLTFPAQWVRESGWISLLEKEAFPQLLSLAKEMVFEGRQRIILLYDADDQLVKIAYEGNAGFSEDDLRNISLEWRCARKDHQIRDWIQLKTPAVKGGARNNVVIESNILKDENGQEALTLACTYDENLHGDKQKITENAQLSIFNGKLTGKVQFVRQKAGQKETWEMMPDLQIQDGGCIGTMEYFCREGKNDKEQVTLSVHAGKGKMISFPESDDDPILLSSDGKQIRSVMEKTARELLMSLLLLPPEDIAFLNEGMPSDEWTGLTKYINAGGTL